MHVHHCSAGIVGLCEVYMNLKGCSVGIVLQNLENSHRVEVILYT
jgi:hypothetical protein